MGILEQTEEIRVRPIFASTVILPPSNGKSTGFQAVVAISKAAAQKALVLVCMLVAAKFLWPEFVGLAALSKATSMVSPFWKGVILSCVASSACLWIVGVEIGKSLDMTKGLRRYPPVTKPTKAIRGATKIASQSANALDPVQFQSLILTERTQLTPSTHKFTLSVQDTQSTTLYSLPAGQHVQLRVETEGGLVTRSYTPTLIDTLRGRMELTIKVYAGSKMGSHLLALPVGSFVDVRGPIGGFKHYHRFLCKDLCMIAAGTGITPVWQVLNAICADPTDDTRVTLLYGNTTQDDILLRAEINALAVSFPNKLAVHYFVSEADSSWTGERGRVNAEKMKQLLPAVSKSSKYLVCGPDAMVDQVTSDLVGLGADGPKAFKHATDQVFVF